MEQAHRPEPEAAAPLQEVTAHAKILLECMDDVDRIEGELKAAKARRDAAQEALASKMVALGLQNFKLASGETPYLQTKLQVSKRGGVSMRDAVEALRLAGEGFCDTVGESYSAATLKSLVRELWKQYREEHPDDAEAKPLDAIPEVLRSNFQIYEQTVVGVNGRKKRNVS